MVTLADFSDTQFLMTCKRCEQTLQEGDRFCRYCGQDQQEGDPAAVIDITQPASNGDVEAPTPLAAQRAERRDAWRQPAQQQQQDTAQQNGAPDGRPGGAVAPRRWSMGLAAVMLIALAVALLHDLYRAQREESIREQAAAQRAAAVREQGAPASADTPAASHEAPAASASAVGGRGDVPAGRPVPGDSTVSVDVTPPVPAPEQPASAPKAAAAPPVSPVPASGSDTLPPVAASPNAAAPPAAESPRQQACPDALAAMALCPNR